MSRRTPGEGRIRRTRSLTETLLSIVLVLEAFVLFFAALVIFGLGKLDPNWLALVYGGILMAIVAAASGVQRWSWGVWLGAVLQIVIISIGFLESAMFLLGAAFAAMWVYCFVRGRQIDAQKAAWLAANTEAAPQTPTPQATPTQATPTEGDTP